MLLSTTSSTFGFIQCRQSLYDTLTRPRSFYSFFISYTLTIAMVLSSITTVGKPYVIFRKFLSNIFTPPYFPTQSVAATAYPCLGCYSAVRVAVSRRVAVRIHHPTAPREFHARAFVSTYSFVKYQILRCKSIRYGL